MRTNCGFHALRNPEFEHLAANFCHKHKKKNMSYSCYHSVENIIPPPCKWPC